MHVVHCLSTGVRMGGGAMRPSSTAVRTQTESPVLQRALHQVESRGLCAHGSVAVRRPSARRCGCDDLKACARIASGH